MFFGKPHPRWGNQPNRGDCPPPPPLRPKRKRLGRLYLHVGFFKTHAAGKRNIQEYRTGQLIAVVFLILCNTRFITPTQSL